jgi:hypothetical protein
MIHTPEGWLRQILTASWRAELPPTAISVGISRGTPRGVEGFRRLRCLEPGTCFRSVTPALYLELCCKILDRLNPAEIYDRLIALGDWPVMLCWESASDCHSAKTFCHRHLVAQWLEDRLGIEVLELGHPSLDRFAFLAAQQIKAPDFKVPMSDRLDHCRQYRRPVAPQSGSPSKPVTKL